MANTPQPPKLGRFLPGPNLSGGGEWGSAPKKVLGEDPIGVRERESSSYVQAGSADIVDERDNSQVAGATRWSAGKVSPEHVALSHSNLEELGDEARVELRGLLDRHVPTFHAFINGDVAPGAVSDLLLDAERVITSSGRFESIEHFFGGGALEGDYITESEHGTYAFPGDEHGAEIARVLGWNADAFTDFVKMARVANHERLVVSSGERLPGTTKHMERLYRMLRLLQEKGAFFEADAYLERIFAENGAADRITMENLVCIYGKAVAEDLDFFDIIEVLLNATWGDEDLLVSKNAIQGSWLTEDGWHEDEQDRVYVSARALADAASVKMHGAHRQVTRAAIIYSMLAEQHLHGVGESEGRYDFYLRELARKKVRGDVVKFPAGYYDDVDPMSKRSKSGEMNNERALARLRLILLGNDFGGEVAKITDAQAFIELDRPPFRDLELDISWVEDVGHYARATLYALLAVARFNQAGEEVRDDDPEYARISFTFARGAINIYEERSIVLQYLSGPMRDSVLHLIVQPFDMMMFNRLYKRIRRNQKKVTPQKQPPPRR